MLELNVLVSLKLGWKVSWEITVCVGDCILDVWCIKDSSSARPVPQVGHVGFVLGICLTDWLPVHNGSVSASLGTGATERQSCVFSCVRRVPGEDGYPGRCYGCASTWIKPKTLRWLADSLNSDTPFLICKKHSFTKQMPSEQQVFKELSLTSSVKDTCYHLTLCKWVQHFTPNVSDEQLMTDVGDRSSYHRF